MRRTAVAVCFAALLAIYGASLLLGAPRSGKWHSLEQAFLRAHPTCEACGTKHNLNVHHIKPFHLDPSRELDWSNLITLCREHHFTIVHDPDGPDGPLKPNWKLENRNVRADAERMRQKLNPNHKD